MSSIDLGSVTAYSIAVKYGFEGTEAEWMQAIIEAGENAQIASESAEIAESSAEIAKIQYGSPLVVSQVGNMTDTNRVYVYIGNETGYVTGNWYYYNGSTWVSGGVYNSTAVSAILDENGYLTFSSHGVDEDADIFVGNIQEAVSDWLDEHPEVTTTVEDHSLTYKKLVNGTLGFVTPEMFGAKGDGVTDDHQAVQDAINSGSKRIVGKGTYLIPTRVIINGLSDVTIDGLHLISMDGDSPTSATIDIKGGAKNINIINCTFDYGVSCVHLLDCDNISISNNNFNETWYAIIQEAGYVSNDVVVSGNHATDLIRDFVECNCEVDAPSKNWIINSNTYDRTVMSTTYYNECRFVGLTAIENVNISDNIINNTQGNAIHCEDIGGQIIISNNVIVDSVGYDIDIDNGNKHTIISGNYIKNTIASKTRTTMVNLSAGSSTAGEYKILIDGNVFYGNGTQSDPLFISTSSQYERQVINNKFVGFHTIFRNEDKPYGNYIYNLYFSNNVVDCTYLINFVRNATLHSTLQNSIFSNNRINGDVFLSDDGNGSLIPTNILFNGNILNGDVTIQYCGKVLFSDNIIPDTKNLVISNTTVCGRINNLYNGSKPAWEMLGQKSYACASANTLENTGLSFEVPNGETWMIYVDGSYSNSRTDSYAITKGQNSIGYGNLTQFMNCGQRSPMAICDSGTWYVYVAQATSGSNVYKVYGKSTY